LLPTLTVNGTFMREFVSADAPCFAFGLVEEGNRRCGFVALRPGKAIPRDVSDRGFRFGHGLLGNDNFEVVHFGFEFYGFETYNALVNPNNPLSRAALTAMVESGGYFFFALDSNESVTAFRSEIGQGNLMMLKSNLARIRASTTTGAQYNKAVASFTRNPEPPGPLLRWVCREDEYLNLAEDRLELTPCLGPSVLLLKAR
jgi:hypothetical protein